MAQDPIEGTTRRNRRTGEVQVFRGGQWVQQTPPQQAQGYRLQPMQTPADRRADAAADRAARNEERAIAGQERQLERDERADVRSERDGETGLRKEFEALQPVKDFRTVQTSYQMVETAAQQDSAAGDVALIFAFMRMLDPNSVVREGEFATAQNAAGVPDQVRNMYNRALSGERLSPRQRTDFLTTAAGVYLERGQAYNATAERYRGLAEQYGFSPDNVAAPIEFRPGETPANAVDANDREAVSGLKAGDWVLVDGEPRRLTTDPEVGVARGDPAGGGVFVNEDEVRSERNAQNPILRQLDAGVRGAADALSFGLADEISAGANALIPLDRGSSSVWQQGKGFQQAYQENVQRQRAIDRADQQDAGAARLTGQVAGAVVAPGAISSGRYIAAAPSMVSAVGRGSAVGAAYGGAYAAGGAEGGVQQRLQAVGPGAMTGAIFGGPLAGVSRGVGGAIAGGQQRMMTSPRAQMVQTLQDNGVFLTPGQRMGGLVGTAENLAQRAPILGTAIRGAHERGLGSLNRAVGNRALDAVGEGLPPSIEPGGDMVAAVGDRLGQEFERGYALVQRFTPDDGLAQGFARIGQEAADLPPAIQQQFAKIVSDRAGRLQGEISGAQVGQIRTGLNQLAARYRQAPDPDQQALGGLLTEVIDELDASIARTNPEAGQILGRARDGYTDYIRMERASTAAGGRPFSPGQLETAVRQSDSSVRRGAMGRGEARMQDLSRAAREIMPDQFGNPGTADAVGLGALGVGAMTEPVTTAAAATGLAAAATPYFLMGRKVVERLPAQASRQQLQQALGELDDLARQDSNVIVLRDEITRRLARSIPAASALSTDRAQPRSAGPSARLMTGSRGG